MSTAPATPNRADPTVPSRDPSATLDSAASPARITRLLVLIRWIISYGTDLAETLHQRAAQPGFHVLTRHHGTSDLTIIAARIRRALMLAGALLATLDRRTAQGRDIARAPICTAIPHEQGPKATPKPRAPRRTNLIDRPLDHLPTPEDIALELRRRPLGAVLVDICRDLGLKPGDLDAALWRELRYAVTEYGGNLTTLVFKGFTDTPPTQQPASQTSHVPPTATIAHSAAAASCTGPP